MKGKSVERIVRFWFIVLLTASLVSVAPAAESATEAAGPWQTIEVPGAWTNASVASAPATGGYVWCRAWLKPHPGFFTPHERNLFSESVTLSIRDLSGAHEVFVNGTRIGGGGAFPPAYRDGRAENHRHKVPPTLLRPELWNEIAIRVFNPKEPAGFLGEAPFIMDYFNECVLEGPWEFRRGDDLRWKGGPQQDRPAQATFERYHESNRVLGEAATFVHGPKLLPEQSLAQLKPSPDLQVELLLHEPLIAQPTHLSFDARGRLWVAQYRQYPYPAGVRMLSRDKYYRSHFDRVPPPPPHQDRGRDRLSIHEDTDGDGRYDVHKVFVDGLNLANAALPAPSGVWVMNTPYLLFYPDADGDDVPDGPPAVHLSGFGLEDTHSVANGLVWGPDGWIYGAQGSTTSSRVMRPGVDPPGFEGVYFEGCMVWRYHPQTRVYEIFAEGTGNIFGLEFDGQGRLFSGHNGAETRGWHYLQGGYYMKQSVDPGKFGPPRNPYAFGELPWMQRAAPIQRFTHAVAVVESTALPAPRQGRFWFLDPVHSLVQEVQRLPRGSTFATADGETVLSSQDQAFRPVYIVNAPDGSMLIADFYEHYIAHGQHYQSQIDPTTGRIYRLRGRHSALESDVNLARKSDRELLALLSHPNKWHRQTASRVLGQRRNPETLEALRGKATDTASDAQGSLGALWALHQAGALDDVTALRVLSHRDASVRAWCVRLLCDTWGRSDAVFSAMARQAGLETNSEVRAQMASSARRLPLTQALLLTDVLMSRTEDLEDPCVPLLCWWVLESHVASQPEDVVAFFQSPARWDYPLVREHILPRLMRRFAQEGRRQDLLVCARLLRMAPSATHVAQLLKGFEEAFRGRSVSALPDELVSALADAGSISLALRVRRGEPEAIAEASRLIQDSGAKLEERLNYTRLLGELGLTNALPALLAAASCRDNAAVAKAAFASLGAFALDTIATRVLELLPALTADLRPSAFALLTSRSTWSMRLLQAVELNQVDTAAIPADTVRRLHESADAEVAALSKKLWPETLPALDLKKAQARVESALKGGPGNPYAGQGLFNERCAGCHTLFYQGGHIGPDLTPYQRDRLDTLLFSVVNPNAEVREGYQFVQIETTDGRTVGGFVADRDARAVVLRDLEGQDVVLPSAQIQAIKPVGRSLMPEGLLEDLTDAQVRDLFAFLRSSQPFK